MENELSNIMKEDDDDDIWNKGETLSATYTFGGNPSPDFDSGFTPIETIECRNTYSLQLASLLIFADAIDYEYTPCSETDGDNFIYVGEGKTDFGIVRFNTMTNWYNHCFMRGSFHGWHGFEKELPKCTRRLRLSPIKMTTAVNSKLIRQVFLQSDRAKNLTVQKHIVRMSNNIQDILSRGSAEDVKKLEEVCDWDFEKVVVEDIKEEEK